MGSRCPQLAGSCESSPWSDGAITRSSLWLTEGGLGQDTQCCCQLSSMSHPCSTDSKVNYVFGENRKNGAFWISKGTWQGNREAQRRLRLNFPVNMWFWKGKNFLSFMYKPGGAGNPQLFLVGTLKDCIKLNKIFQNFSRNFGTSKTVTWQLCAFFGMKPAASWDTVGCCVTCVTFLKLFYKVTGWKSRLQIQVDL